MRILCFLHALDIGGVERTAMNLCRQWRSDGLDVRMMLGRASALDRAALAGMPHEVAPAPFPTAWIETWWMIAWLPAAIRRTRPDILYCAGNSYTVVAVLMKLLLGRHCPPIVAKISNDLVRRDMPAPVRALYSLWCLLQGRLIDRWIAFSPRMAGEAAIILGIPRASIAVLANAVLNPDLIARLKAAGDRARSSQGGETRFLAVGRLVAQKDFEVLIGAFAAVKAPLSRLTIVGEGPLRHRLEHQVAELGLAARIDLPGRSDAIEAHLARADVLILSSRYEGMPSVVIEAMAAGLPIVATDCCASMSCLIDDPDIGTLIPAGAPEALALAIAVARPRPEPTSGMERVTAFMISSAARSYAALFVRLLEDRGAESVEVSEGVFA